MNEDPKISVIVPIYNSEKYLRQCLNSILGQSFPFFELILIDDGSSDSSREICTEYLTKDSRISLYLQKHKGVGPARNMGLKLATGEYLSFLDSDDFFEPDMLEKLYGCAEKHNSDIVFYWYQKFDDISQQDITIIPNKYLSQIPNGTPFSPQNHKDILFQLSGGEAWKYFFKSDFVRQYDLKFAKTTCGEDIVFTIPARALASRIVFLNEPFVHYRINTKNQLTKRPNILSQLKKSYKQAWIILKKHNLTDMKPSFQERKKTMKQWVERNRK